MNRAPLDLAGAHAVVTGASRGIGVALAEELAARGAKVTVLARSEAPLKDLADRIGGHAIAIDLTDPDALVSLTYRIESERGPIDVLVNNAAMSAVGRVIEQNAAELAQSIALNLSAPVELVRQVLPGMVDRGRGRIVNISSLAGISAFPTIALYGGTKAGLVHFSAALQRELRSTAVRVTIAHLGEVAGTDMMEQSRQSPTIAAVAQRLNRVKAMPPSNPQQVARDVVDAASAGRPNVVVPRRASGFRSIRDLPSRINDLILTGIE